MLWNSIGAMLTRGLLVTQARVLVGIPLCMTCACLYLICVSLGELPPSRGELGGDFAWRGDWIVRRWAAYHRGGACSALGGAPQALHTRRVEVPGGALREDHLWDWQRGRLGYIRRS